VRSAVGSRTAGAASEEIAVTSRPGEGVLVSLAERLLEDMKRAMKMSDSLRVSVIRLARAAIRNAEIEKGRTLSDAEVVEVLQREVRKRKEAIEGFLAGGRNDLARREELEMAILMEYLPPPMEETELRRLIADAIAAVQAVSERDLGKVMGKVMPQVKGRVDGKVVERLVREMLSSSREEPPGRTDNKEGGGRVKGA
jgi:uncharacterized protein YqeY